MSAFRIQSPSSEPLFKQPTPVRKKKLQMGRQPRERDEAHLAALRRCQCISCGLDAGCEAAHVRTNRGPGTGGGMGMKPHDRNCLPLCVGCHRQQHAEGEQIFYDAIDLDPNTACRQVYSVSPDIPMMRAIVGRILALRE